MDVGTADARLPDVPRGDIGERGRAADVDVTVGDVGDELAEVIRGQVPPALLGRVIADDVVELGAGRGRQLVELGPEEDVLVGDDAVDDDDVAAHLLKAVSYTHLRAH